MGFHSTFPCSFSFLHGWGSSRAQVTQKLSPACCSRIRVTFNIIVYLITTHSKKAVMGLGYSEAKIRAWIPKCGSLNTHTSCEGVGLTFIGAKQLFLCISICAEVTSHPLPPSSCPHFETEMSFGKWAGSFLCCQELSAQRKLHPAPRQLHPKAGHLMEGSWEQGSCPKAAGRADVSREDKNPGQGVCCSQNPLEQPWNERQLPTEGLPSLQLAENHPALALKG